MKYLISTDLDGTLLDHHTYSWLAAKPAIDSCKQRGVPIVLNTSKTFAEVAAIHGELDLESPIIVENGSALILSSSEIGRSVDLKTVKFGVERSSILAFIANTRAAHGWKFEGFNDWQTDQISAHTGLSSEQATLAAKKQFSEPFLWNDTESALSEFCLLAEQQGFKIVRGGRFYHLQGQTDKSVPLAWLINNFQQVFDVSHKEAPKLICLGDNDNDIAMLNIADYPVCVKSPVASYPHLSTDKPVIRTVGEGPVGWNEAIQKLLIQP